MSISSKIFNYTLFFLITNIPTIITFGIFLGYRKKRTRNKAIDKMKLQDL